MTVKQLSICPRCDELKEAHAIEVKLLENANIAILDEVNVIKSSGAQGFMQVTEHVQELIDQLARCTFHPASFDKRFVRSLESKKVGDKISDRQLLFLGQIAYRYRKQREGLRKL